MLFLARGGSILNMCGRYQLALSGRTLADLLGVRLDMSSEFCPTWNAAPSQMLPVIHANGGSELVLQAARWGLMRSGSNEHRSKLQPLINARSETILERPSFRELFASSRILVPATGFYEWTGPKGDKTPHLFRVRDNGQLSPALFAGLWQKRIASNGQVESAFTIITTRPNELCARVHNRMPVILSEQNASEWLLTPPSEARSLLKLLAPYPSELMETWPVSTDVSDVTRDGPELSRPQWPAQGSLI